VLALPALQRGEGHPSKIRSPVRAAQNGEPVIKMTFKRLPWTPVRNPRSLWYTFPHAIPLLFSFRLFDCSCLRRLLRAASESGSHSAHGMEQLGCLWPHHRRGRLQGQYRGPCRRQAVRLALFGHRRGLVYGKPLRWHLAGEEVRVGCERHSHPRSQPLSFRGRWPGLQAARRFCALQRAEVRHPHRARHPPPGGQRESAHRRIQLSRRRCRGHERALPMGRRKLWRCR